MGGDVARIYRQKRSVGEFNGGDGVPLGGEGFEGEAGVFEGKISKFSETGVGGFDEVPVGVERDRRGILGGEGGASAEEEDESQKDAPEEIFHG